MMIRAYQIQPECVDFIAYLPHKNHSVEHLHPVHKGAYRARSLAIKWIIGVLWKYFGIGGRK